MKTRRPPCFRLYIDVALFALGIGMAGGAAGCESSSGVADSDGDQGDDDGQIDDDSDGDDDDSIDTDGFDDDDDNDDNDTDSGTDDICAEVEITLVNVPTRLLIVQDMSRSMTDALGQSTKWDVAKAATTKMLNDYGDKIEFGYDIFPDEKSTNPFDMSCSVDNPLIADTASNNGAAIISQINALSPDGRTPLHSEMTKFTVQGYAPNFQTQDATRYLLIVSDGQDTCGLNNNQQQQITPQNLTDVTKQLLDGQGIMTFVIGFVTDEAAPAELNAIAAAGGTPYTEYLDAQNQQELEDALSAIADLAISCIYEIPEQDQSDVEYDKVKFYFDGVEIGWDPDCQANKGWTWLDTTYTKVEFCEEACAKLKTGAVAVISATFGCPPTPIE